MEKTFSPWLLIGFIVVLLVVVLVVPQAVWVSLSMGL
ncbi:hypothetical protein BREVNS_0172 [Brevinematales bacterium NS]|jgi:hypothetical protein|nr:hypothetical protein BREVNS_0172 [Brevinematales bacterium NS]